MHLFKSRQKTPVEIVHRTRHLLLKYDQRKTTDSGKCKREEEKMAEELSENLREMKLILYSPIAGDEPAPKACAELTEEIFRENTFRLVIMNLPKLTLEARRDATYIVVNLQRQKVHSRLVASDFLEANLDLMDVLVQGYEYADTDESLAVLYGNMLRECTRHQTVARYVLESQQHMEKLFGYIQLPKFEIAVDAGTTFEQLMTRHRSTAADFMSKNYDWFFSEYNKLMESPNYATRLQAVKLLGDMLQHHSNSAVTTRYVSSKENLRVVMNLLREPSKNIDVKAVHVFKLFAANQKKPADIVAILVANRGKLLKLLAEFKADKNDEDQFEADKARVVTDITALKPREIELSCISRRNHLFVE